MKFVIKYLNSTSCDQFLLKLILLMGVLIIPRHARTKINQPKRKHHQPPSKVGMCFLSTSIKQATFILTSPLSWRPELYISIFIYETDFR